MKVSVICENTVSVPVPKGLIGEHGLAFLIEGKKTTLFDTGQGTGIINNLRILGKDINEIDQLIISHGHYDHTGGLMEVLTNRSKPISVYIHPDAFKNKIALVVLPQKNIEVPIGMPFTKKEYEDKKAEFKQVNKFTKIDDDLYTISDIDRPTGWKTWDVRLKQKEGDTIKDDPFNDDLSLLLETDAGPVVLLGCAHAGVVEILEDLSNKTGYKEFHAVIGGTHLGTAPDEYINKAMDIFKKYAVKIIGTSHCTGFNAASRVASNFREEFKSASVGDSFEF